MKSIRLLFILLLATQLVYGQDEKLRPDFIVVQYAGSIGYLSVGTGYGIFKQRGRASLHFGNIPASQGGNLNVVAAKFAWTFKSFDVSGQWNIKPIDVGLMMSYHFGDEFKLSVPNYFKSDNYYWWHTAMRLHLITESSATLMFKEKAKFKSITGYLEFNTNDLYLVSFISNTSSLKLHQLIKGALGLRLTF